MSNTRLTRKNFLQSMLALGVAACIAPMSAVAADAYPNRPIRLVVPFAPGGNTDLMARILGQSLSEELGQPVVVENVAGANGSIGASRVASAAKDGYTLLFGTAGTQAINQSLYKSLSEKNLDDYEYLGLVAYIPNILVVNESRVPAKNVAEFVEFAKQQAEGLSYGSPGAGSTIHLSAEMLGTTADLSLLHVPYRGSAPALSDLMGAQLDFIFENITPAMPFVTSGKLKALAVASEERVAALPDVPTMIESGYDNFVTGTWNGVLAPKGTPAEITERISAAVIKSAQDPDFQKKVAEMGGQPRAMPPAEFKRYTQDEYKRWNAVIEAAGVEKM
ncbi:tripartite tricarboxylate transporter substrate binding protein [Lampropedia aestuarii]|uniref:Tripartite tricarboxylate transporter substrate binding protein n=1 Tax=Lampropedia aestuarii TaxID=2562762 RepID=A0A4S5BG91_9BURK|nr:tripartite tricarboxylate transporter substrate binding protein [Lampropedia aestuarii]MDH5859092.1 tripartite tricarboxylate transporter substrate binding protein [Lampropedia aestuarii]THJ31280.1 tripartite tricarboxylate transporter substrate binding protein [Lampropedia aestuarii]